MMLFLCSPFCALKPDFSAQIAVKYTADPVCDLWMAVCAHECVLEMSVHDTVWVCSMLM